ncbi:polymorphic toxin type 44 domain-containing protein [Bacillus toyonensis]|uniref:polymorphic toxin type 44 domain-containing protein n=1 Tax=Bacillus toyonensis TaxID=155322 RepID=UPI002175A59C|nr:polymorphic toxin type 44 domain-containing protein [Bacillus toyonensis]
MKKKIAVLGVSCIFLSSFALTPVSAATKSTTIATDQQLPDLTNYKLSPELEHQAEQLADEIAQDVLRQEASLGLRLKLQPYNFNPGSDGVKPTYTDLTNDFTSIMKANKNRMKIINASAEKIAKSSGNPVEGAVASRAYRYTVFTKLVKSGGPWDYKLKYGPKTTYTFDNRTLTGEDLGNFHYGYVGKAIGFTDIELKGGAGFYQVLSNTWEWEYYKTFFDDPRDQEMIQVGIDYYNKGY